MSILVDDNTRLVVQGITGSEGLFHTERMIEYGTRVVAGVTPGKGGTEVLGVPVFDSVAEAVREAEANTSVIYVPAGFAADAILEAAYAGIKVVVCISEGIPTLDMLMVCDEISRTGTVLIGPNCPGIISPGKTKVGIMSGEIHRPGSVGVVSRSGTLTYEIVNELTTNNLGQSSCLGIGGDPVVGSNFLDILPRFEADPETEAVVLVGEIGGTDEERAAEYVKAEMSKPVVAFIAGHTAPPGKRMGHAGAIISGGTGTAQEKVKALAAAGIPVATLPEEVPGLVKKCLS